MTALTIADLSKLAKVCAMFSSTFDGERAAAAAHADRIVKSAGLTWPDLLQPPPDRGCKDCAQQNRRHVVRMTPGEILGRHGARLSQWERNLCVSLIRTQRWTDRQRASFDEIHERIVRVRT